MGLPISSQSRQSLHCDYCRLIFRLVVGVIKNCKYNIELTCQKLGREGKILGG